MEGYGVAARGTPSLTRKVEEMSMVLHLFPITEEMSTQLLLNTIKMFFTAGVKRKITTDAVHREVSINPAKRNKENLLHGLRRWTCLWMCGVRQPGHGVSLLQPEEEPVLHIDDLHHDEDVEAGHAELCKNYLHKQHSFFKKLSGPCNPSPSSPSLRDRVLVITEILYYF